MKTNHAAQRLFSRANISGAGIALATVRMSFAWASFWIIGQLSLEFPALIEAAKQSTTPFIEILAIIFFSSAWRVVLSLCLVCIAIGLFTRPAAAVLGGWALVFTVLAFPVMTGALGQWTVVWFCLLGVLLTTSWGRVWGLDDVIVRMMRSRNKVLRMLLSADEV